MERAARSEDVREGELFATHVDKRSVLLTRVEGHVYAVENRCAHLGMSMAKGTLVGQTLRCPWHGSKFDVCTGEPLDWVDSFAGIPTPRWTHGLIALGKRPAPIQTFVTTEADGSIYIHVPK